MSPFVLDCSIAASWCFEDEARPEIDALLDRTRDHGAVVPALWHWEIANVLAMAVRRGRIAAGDATTRLSLMGALPIATDTDTIARAWREALLLAHTHTLPVYDAAYLELAIPLGAPLASRDSDLQAAVRRNQRPRCAAQRTSKRRRERPAEVAEGLISMSGQSLIDGRPARNAEGALRQTRPSAKRPG